MDATYVILSDTHGRSDLVDEVLNRQIHVPDAILFSGDGIRDIAHLMDSRSIFAVLGNNDLSYRVDSLFGGYPHIFATRTHSACVVWY